TFPLCGSRISNRLPFRQRHWPSTVNATLELATRLLASTVPLATDQTVAMVESSLGCGSNSKTLLASAEMETKALEKLLSSRPAWIAHTCADWPGDCRW